MPGISREQENTPDLINWFTTVNGVLTDMYEVGFQIWDITGGLPGTCIFPNPVDDTEWEDVTSGGGHYSVGHYYAYDNDNTEGWTPPLTTEVGTHRIKWRWKSSAAAQYQSGQEDFEVLLQSEGSTVDNYISVQDVRDEGLSAADYPDSKVLAYIEVWQAFIDRACRQWFNSRLLVLSLDGTDSDTLFMGVPIISVEYLKLNGSTDELSTELYKVYNSRRYPDDRRNPRIKLIGPDAWRDIFVAPLVHGDLKFRRGYQNQEVKGLFGFTEEDGSTPKLIKRALLKLVVEKLTEPVYEENPSPSPPPILGPILEEKTDGHSIKYANPSASEPRNFGLSGITEDPEIHDIIKLYKSPLKLAAPAHWSYF